MLTFSITPGSGWGATDTRLTKDVDFKCSATVCYAQGGSSVEALFKDLQRAINMFAPVAGFASLKVDGIIGRGTVIALNKALGLPSVPPGSAPGSIAQVAEMAFELKERLRAAAGAPTGTQQVAPMTAMTAVMYQPQQQMVSVTPGGQPGVTPTPGGGVTPTPGGQPGVTSTPPAQRAWYKSPWVWGSAIAVVVAGTGAYLVMRRRPGSRMASA